MSSYNKLKSIRDNCSKCDGSGFNTISTEGGIYMQQCTCVDHIENNIKWIEANIPDEYWDFSLQDVSTDFAKDNTKQLKFVDKYIKNLDVNIRGGKGIWFFSPTGLGKSTAMTTILKEAVNKDYIGYFARTSRIIKWKFESLRDKEKAKLIDYIVDDVDILALDEFEKIYLLDNDSLVNQLFYEFLSDIHDSNKAILISTNAMRKDVSMKLPTFIQDRLKSLDEVIFSGVSKRKKFYEK